MSTDGRTVFFVILLTMAHVSESWVRAQDTASEPDGVSLNHVLADLNFDRSWVSSHFLVSVKSIIHSVLDEFVQFFVKAVKQSAAS